MGMELFQGFTEVVYNVHMVLHGMFSGTEESTMMSYFSKYQIQEHWPKVALSTVRDVQCPVLQSSELGGQPETSCSAPELFDWLGAVFCNADLWVSELPGLCGALACCLFSIRVNTSDVIM
jgi:predicted amidohydrolase